MGLFYTTGELEDFLDYNEENVREYIRFKRCVDCAVLGVFLFSANLAVINYFT